MDIQKYEADLKAQHAALTKAFEEAQVKAEAAWSKAEKHSKALTEFRSKYLRVLKALGEVKVEG